jgi:type IV secretion system protein VirB11
MNVVAISEKRIDDVLQPILGLLKCDTITDIMANEDGSVWISDLNSGKSKTDIMLTVAEIDRIIHAVASSARVEISRDRNPSVSCMLIGWDARFQGQIFPAAPNGSYFAIRRHLSKVFLLEDYVDSGLLTMAYADFLKEAVIQKKNILVVGSTGSGKTTLLNALLHEIAQTGDRCALIEEQQELRFPIGLNCFRQNTSRPDIFDGKRAIRDALRLNPDRIIYGEIRDGAAAQELIRAWNTGHSGGLATIHANSAIEALDRIDELLMEVMTHTPPASLITRAIDMCIFISYEYGIGRKIHPPFVLQKPHNDKWKGKNTF